MLKVSYARPSQLGTKNMFESLTTVIVEDNVDNMVLLRYYIRRLGVRGCHTLESGRELFELLEREPALTIDVLFLDIQIPFEDGYTILRQLRQHPRGHATRVVAVTAHVMRSDVLKAREAGFDGFLGKPINPLTLEGHLLRIFGGESVWDVGY
jgi:two-component system cell cycle response regulator DivK